MQRLPAVDLENIARPQYAAQYAERICLHAQEAEERMRIDPDRLTAAQGGSGVTAENRAALVRWMTWLHHHTASLDETLYMAIYYLDVMLTSQPVAIERLELLGVVCFWMAAKMNEVHPLTADELRDQCTQAYTREQFLELESEIFRGLSVNLQYPSTVTFLRRYLQAIHANEMLANCANFLCEISLLAFELNQFSRSTLAVVLVLAAAAGLDIEVNVGTVLAYAHLTDLGQVMPCAALLLPIVGAVLADRDGPTYVRFASGEAERALTSVRWDETVLEGIRRLIR